MSKYSKAFRYLVSECSFSYSGSGDEYEDYVWHGPGEQPSKAQCDAVLPTIETAEALSQAQRNRQAAYQAEADPLYFGFQRGENTEQVWLDKVTEIRARYPYPA